MDVGLKIIQTIFVFAVLVLVYGKIHNDDPEAYQNIRGIIFFVAVTNSFGGIQGTLATFASERAIFIRERYSRTYSLVPYFLGRTLAN